MLSDRMAGVLRSVSEYRRGDRIRTLHRLFAINGHWNLLDISCGENWRSLWFSPELNVTGMDVRPITRCAYRKFVCCDATHLPFADKSFDLAFSNSLIEHLPDRESQARFASEVARVAKRFWIQTPNTDFPVDPHYLIPFFQHLPEGLQRRIAYTVSGTKLLAGYYITRGFDVEEYSFAQVLGLNPRSLRSLFPFGGLLHFRFAGLSQSIVVVQQ